MLKKKIKRINSELIKKYGVPPRSKIPPDPVDMLIATILSQNTNDKNSYKAFNNLKNSYKSWEDVAKASQRVIESKIKTAGLGKQKSSAIKSFLTSIIKERGEISLKFLSDFNDDEALQKLTNYDGVGLKTASCVLQFSLRRNLCPVDTHVHRTTNRLGLVDTKTADKTFKILYDNMPDNIAHQFHTNLIRLGREICKPAKPLCAICPLVKLCEYENKNMDINSVYKENPFMLLDSIK